MSKYFFERLKQGYAGRKLNVKKNVVSYPGAISHVLCTKV